MAISKGFPLSVIVEAVDRLTGPLRRMGTSILGFHKRLTNIGSSISRGLGVPQFTQNLREAQDHFGRFTGMVGRVTKLSAAIAGLTVGVAAFGAVQIGSFTDFASNIKDNSTRLHVSAETLQAWSQGASLAGIKGEEFVKILQKLNVNLGKAAMDRTSDTAKLLDALGFDPKDRLTGRLKDITKSLPEIADLINKKVRDPMKRSAVEAALFGEKLGPKLETLLKEGSSGFDRITKAAYSFGTILSNDVIDSAEEFGDKLEIIKTAIVGVRNTIIAQMLPVLHKLADQLLETIRKNIPNIKAWAEQFGKSLPDRIEKARVFLEGLGKTFKQVQIIVGFLADNLQILQAVLVAITAVYILNGIIQLSLAFKALGFAMLLTPTGLLIAAFAAIAVAAFLIWKNWDKLKAWWLALWPDLWQAVKDFVKDISMFVLQHNPIAILLRTANDLIRVLTGFDMAKAFGSSLPDWVQKLLGVGNTNLTTLSSIAQAAAPDPSAPRSAVPDGSGGLRNVNPRGAVVGAGAVGVGRKSEVKFQFDFNNLPAGTKVKTENKDGIDFGLNQGYQFSR